MKTIGIVGIVVVVCALALMVFMGYVSSSNQEIRLRNSVAAQQDVCRAYFDTMWKVISQQAEVSDKYRETFKEIYPAIMEGRYGNARGGALMSWIHEANPDFSTALYSKLMTSIEGLRISFFREQEKLRDIKREHDNVLTIAPTSWFVGNRPKIDIILVTSAKTKEIYKSGQEDDTKLFPKK